MGEPAQSICGTAPSTEAEIKPVVHSCRLRLVRPEEALRYYVKAAETGNAVAQHIVGTMLSSGRTTDSQLVEAVQWFRRSAEGGFAPAQFQLGVLYCTAKGVEQNLEEAVRWYEAAAASQHKMAMYNLGVMLIKGMGIEADPVRGEELMRKSEITPSPTPAEAVPASKA